MFDAVIDKLMTYYPLYMALMVWIMFIAYIKNLEEIPGSIIRSRVS